MLSANRIKTDIEPKKIEKLGNGYYYYNYDIQSEVETVSDQDGNSSEKTFYNFIQVRLNGTPNYKDCVKAIIREYLDENEEFDIINTYNAVNLGILEDDGKYSEYLNLVNSIKTNIKSDFNLTA